MSVSRFPHLTEAQNQRLEKLEAQLHALRAVINQAMLRHDLATTEQALALHRAVLKEQAGLVLGRPSLPFEGVDDDTERTCKSISQTAERLRRSQELLEETHGRVGTAVKPCG
jgi:hypothetical protein